MSYKEYKYDPYVQAWNRIADGGEICHGGFDPKNDPNDRRKLFFIILASIAFILLFVLFSGCNRKVYVPVERTRTVTEIVKDTIVEVKLEVHCDTVTIESAGRDTSSYLSDDTHYSRVTWKDGKLGHSLGVLPGAKVLDTIPVKYIIIHDSIPYPVHIEVEKELTRWERIKLEYGGLSVGSTMVLSFILGMMILGGRTHRD